MDWGRLSPSILDGRLRMPKRTYRQLELRRGVEAARSLRAIFGDIDKVHIIMAILENQLADKSCGYDIIAQATGLPLTTVKRHLGHMKADGWVLATQLGHRRVFKVSKAKETQVFRVIRERIREFANALVT
jgi:predicted transcriptional regulator